VEEPAVFCRRGNGLHGLTFATAGARCHIIRSMAVGATDHTPLKGNRMKTLLTIFFTAAIALSAADAVSGAWQVHQNIAGNENDLACTFTQTGEDLAGSCDGPNGAMKLTGKVSEKKVTWTIQSDYNGTPLTIKYSGTLTSTTKITGSVSVDPYAVEGEFTAIPAK
jgi:hypothetical protein